MTLQRTGAAIQTRAPARQLQRSVRPHRQRLEQERLPLAEPDTYAERVHLERITAVVRHHGATD